MASIKSHSVLIDVRTLEEWKSGHLKGAIHIPLNIISEDINKFVKSHNEEVLLYCRSGNRSGKAKNILDSLGYSNTINLGGITDASKLEKLEIIKN